MEKVKWIVVILILFMVAGAGVYCWYLPQAHAADENNEPALENPDKRHKYFARLYKPQPPQWPDRQRQRRCLLLRLPELLSLGPAAHPAFLLPAGYFPPSSYPCSPQPGATPRWSAANAAVDGLKRLMCCLFAPASASFVAPNRRYCQWFR